MMIAVSVLKANECVLLLFCCLQVSQKLMVQGYSGHATYTGGIDVATKIIKSYGVRGLYRGFGLSVMTYSPSSAAWWASYGSSQRVIWRSDINFVIYLMISFFVLAGCENSRFSPFH